MDITLPWLEASFPPYTLSRVGKWQLSRTPRVDTSFVGYWSVASGLQPGYRLRKKEGGKLRTWMSLTPMEMQSHQPHIAAATGNVMVAGLGMGMYLFNIVTKPDVENVIVIEQDPDVIAMFDKITDWRNWPDAGKITIRQSDIFATTNPGGRTKIDYLYVDIWEHMSDAAAPEQMKRICDKMNPQKCGFWTQEMEFAMFVARHRLSPVGALGKMSWSRFVRHLGIPLVGAEWECYPELCMLATTLQLLGSGGDQIDKILLIERANSLATAIAEQQAGIAR